MERMMRLLFLCLLVSVGFICACEARSDEIHDLLLRLRHEQSLDDSSPFILEEAEQALKTEWGEIRVLLRSSALKNHHVGLGFITMQPKSLLVPHYIDASFVFILQQGSARLGWVAQGELFQQDLQAGDVYAIPSGTLFYLVSTVPEGELKICGVYDTSEALESGAIKSFYVSGDSSLLSGFAAELLAAAFKVSAESVEELFSAQSKGAIVPTSLETYTKLTTTATTTSNSERWSWQALSNFMLKNKKKDHTKAPRAMSIFSKKRLFENRNGWFASTYGKKLPMLKKSRLGVMAANLTSGALLAPHWNPEAAVIGVVTSGSGSVQIAFPNGTNAANERVEKGSVFFVPRYFPVCELASADGSLEFIGFSVSDKFRKHGHHPQFLTGKHSVLRTIDLETLALSFNMPEELLTSVLQAQADEIILSGLDPDLRSL